MREEEEDIKLNIQKKQSRKEKSPLQCNKAIYSGQFDTNLCSTDNKHNKRTTLIRLYLLEGWLDEDVANVCGLGMLM